MSKPQSLEERLRPYETFILRAQEVLFFKRPVVLGILVFGITSLFSFVRSTESGFFATVALVACVVYAVLIVFRFFGDKIEAVLFKPLDAETDPSAPDRTRSLEEVCRLLEACKCDKCCGEGKGGVKYGIAFLALAVVFKFVPTFYFNAFVVAAVLFLPGIVTRKPVWDAVSPHLPQEKPKTE